MKLKNLKTFVLTDFLMGRVVIKPFSNRLFSNNDKLAYSLAEVIITMIIIIGITLLASRYAIGNNQKIFDTKYAKTASVINGNISKYIFSISGFKKESDFDSNSENFKNTVLSNINYNACTIEIFGPNYIHLDGCWHSSAKEPIEGVNIETNYGLYEINDKVVLAIEQDNLGSRIFVDVNGKKGPNVFGKDIYEYRYSYPSTPPIICSEEKELVSDKCLCKNRNMSPPDDFYLYNEETCEWVDICDNEKRERIGVNCLCKERDKYPSEDNKHTFNTGTCKWSCTNNTSPNGVCIQNTETCEWKCDSCDSSTEQTCYNQADYYRVVCGEIVGTNYYFDKNTCSCKCNSYRQNSLICSGCDNSGYVVSTKEFPSCYKEYICPDDGRHKEVAAKDGTTCGCDGRKVTRWGNTCVCIGEYAKPKNLTWPLKISKKYIRGNDGSTKTFSINWTWNMKDCSIVREASDKCGYWGDKGKNGYGKINEYGDCNILTPYNEPQDDADDNYNCFVTKNVMTCESKDEICLTKLSTLGGGSSRLRRETSTEAAALQAINKDINVGYTYCYKK